MNLKNIMHSKITHFILAFAILVIWAIIIEIISMWACGGILSNGNSSFFCNSPIFSTFKLPALGSLTWVFINDYTSGVSAELWLVLVLGWIFFLSYLFVNRDKLKKISKPLMFFMIILFLYFAWIPMGKVTNGINPGGYLSGSGNHIDIEKILTWPLSIVYIEDVFNDIQDERIKEAYGETDSINEKINRESWIRSTKNPITSMTREYVFWSIIIILVTTLIIMHFIYREKGNFSFKDSAKT